eukprot:m.885582 g.885582  ORF g.885582 m.885582 type:complete len:297 (-) comp23622_c0_seq6:1706-2596(-)
MCGIVSTPLYQIFIDVRHVCCFRLGSSKCYCSTVQVLTQSDLFSTLRRPSSVGLSEWQVDIHAVKRVAHVVNGTWRVINAGGRDTGRTHAAGMAAQVLEVPYEAIIPRRGDTSNLLVPVCASFTHVAFSTFRLEPQYAIFGVAAGVAAVHSVEAQKRSSHASVHDVNISAVQEDLQTLGQLLHTASPASDRFVCALGQCIGVGSHGVFANSSCDGTCPPLAPTRWLAQDCCGIWSRTGNVLTATTQTWLKKSTVDSAQLPPAEKMSVNPGAKCIDASNSTVPGTKTYLFCTYNGYH